MFRFILSIIFLITYVYADFVCWSRKLGYPCCSEGAMVVHEDENGKWGIDKNEWCGILEPEVYITSSKKRTTTTKKITTTKVTTTKSKTTTTTTTTTKKTTTTKITTTKRTTTTTTSKTTTKKPVETNNCWSLVKGYPCCVSKNPKVVEVDKDGKWGLELNPKTNKMEWCGIIGDGDETTTTTTKSSIKPTSTTTTTTKSSIKPTSTTTTKTTTTKRTTSTTTNKPQPTNCVENYNQCGGIGYNGPTCCKSEGFQCTAYSDYYHQCVPKYY